MGAISIRLGAVEDLPALRTIYRHASWSNEGDRTLLAEHPEFLQLGDTAVLEGRTQVAIADGRLVGFVTLLETAATAEIEDLFVAPDFMRKGVGRTLIEAVSAFAAERGWRQIEVDANPHAVGFYAKTGFVEVGQVALEHGTAMRMRRTIQISGAAPT